MLKISDIIVGLLIVSFIGVVFALALANVSTNYGVVYDNSSIQTYNQLTKLNNMTEGIKEGERNIVTDNSVTDVLGSVFASGYKVLRITKQSFTVFGSVTDTAVNSADLGPIGYYLKILIGSIIIILVIVGIIIAAIVKWGL